MRGRIFMDSSIRSFPQRLLVACVRGYRFALSPWLGSSCRFEPTCSAYALDALQTHGAAAGTYLTLRRIGRCHPWCAGGPDPVPADMPELTLSFFRRGTDAVPTPHSTDPTAL